jgi:B12-binding domain/radical SAM domain protein
MKADLILLHPPSVYDFREKVTMWGPISDAAPSTSIFEMYPLGFFSIAEYLERENYRTRILNLALKMLNKPNLNVKKLIKKLNPLAFGIDLHWLVHAHGSLEVARIVKEMHPNTPIILGGLSASYYHSELMAYPQVDYVLRGDSTEEPMLQLMNCISKGKHPENVPNLSWKNSGKVYVNPLTHVPENLDYMTVDPGFVLRSIVKYHDLSGYTPAKNWLRYPMAAVIHTKGCIYNCINCGGSHSAFKNICNRSKPAFKSPEKILEDITTIQQCLNVPISIMGDLRLAGEKHAHQILDALKKERIDSDVVLELYSPAPKTFLKHIADAIPNFYLEFTPETHDESIRTAHGRPPYTNEEVEDTIECAFSLGCKRLDVFFTIGLAGQGMKSVHDTVEYCGILLKKYGKDKRLHPFVSPFVPFLDPGSIAFENPEKYGYQLFYKSLAEHRMALTAPSWKYIMNYQTDSMTREQIVLSTYQAASSLNRLKNQSGIIDNDTSEEIEDRIVLSLKTLAEVDKILEIKDDESRAYQLKQLSPDINLANEPTLCDKNELQLPTKGRKFNFFKIIRLLFER